MSDIRVIGYAARISALFKRSGEGFTLGRGGVTSSQVGLFTPLTSELTSEFFDSDETIGLVRPALALYMDGAGFAPAVDDGFTRDSRDYLVKRTYPYRLSGTLLLWVALCD